MNVILVCETFSYVVQSYENSIFVENRPPKSKLECVANFTLFGNVMSIQSVNLANNPRDALLIAFADAKLSVVEYDSESHDLKTLSLHYFEEEDMKVVSLLFIM